MFDEPSLTAAGTTEVQRTKPIAATNAASTNNNKNK
jgi:hypothetical protein